MFRFIKHTTIVLALSLTTSLNCFGQTATITVVREFFDNSFENFDSIHFQFNDTRFAATDTITKTIKLNEEFDSCIATMGTDTIRFLTKFKSGTEYVIKPGCCCAIFTIQPKDNAKRGTVTFKNETERDLGLVVCEHNSDTVKSNKQQTMHASESAMCLFKPCYIIIVEIDFLTAYYKGELYSESILTEQCFHFLHGEKIEILYDDKTKTNKIKLIGYLTEEEYETN